MVLRSNAVLMLHWNTVLAVESSIHIFVPSVLMITSRGVEIPDKTGEVL